MTLTRYGPISITNCKILQPLYKMPERFPFLNAEFMPINKYHKMFIEKWYLILHQVKDQTVYVDCIVDCRQDYGWLVR